MSNTTTHREVLTAIRDKILAITPSLTRFSAIPWRYVGDLKEGVSDLRTFYFGDSPAHLVTEEDRLLWAAGERYTFELHVHTGYGAMPDGEVDVTSADGRDLRTYLQALVGPTDGLCSIEYLGFAADERIDGKPMTGVHRIRVDYMQDTSL